MKNSQTHHTTAKAGDRGEKGKGVSRGLSNYISNPTPHHTRKKERKKYFCCNEIRGRFGSNGKWNGLFSLLSARNSSILNMCTAGLIPKISENETWKTNGSVKSLDSIISRMFHTLLDLGT